MNRPRALRTFFGAVLLVLVGGMGDAQAQPGPDFYGVNAQPMVKLQVVKPDRWDSYVKQMADDGLRIARVDGAWSWAEPHAPVNGQHSYDWNPADRPDQSLDRIALVFARHGVRLLPALATAPGWAGATGTSLAPAHYSDFAAFAGAFAERYGSGGSFWREHPEFAAVPVTDYEIWTEANSTNFWTHRADAGEYARVLRPVSVALHAADPGARVLASIGWQGFEGYMAEFYAAGARGSFDAIGFHPYAPHAVAIVDLVERMRKALVAAGDGQLPIEVTETGEPRAASGPGATRAGSGSVSDQARAATHALAGDALARSDCGVGSYLLYAIVGSETFAEPAGEGYMGIYSVVDATPNATGRAIGDASLRWRTDPASGLALCSGGTTPAARLLPLELSVDHDGPTCVTGRTTYRGNPLEASQLTLRTADGRVSRFETDAFGSGRVCIPDGPPIYAFDVTTEIANVAMGPTFNCPVPTGACTLAQPAPRQVRAPGTNTSSKSCRYVLTARLRRVVGRRVSASARLTCTGRRLGPARVSVLLQRRGQRKRHALRRITLTRGRTLAFRLTTVLHRGDRLVLVRAADRRRGLTRVEARVTATRRLSTR